MISDSNTGLYAPTHRYLLLFILLGTTACTGSQQASTITIAQTASLPLDVAISLTPEVWSTGFSRIADLHATSSGQVYVADAGRHHVVRLGQNGSRIDSTGGRGARPNQFDQPLHIFAANDLQIFVSDTGNQRLVQFDRRWQHLGYLDIPSDRYVPGPLAVTIQGELIYWDTRNSRIRKTRADFSPDLLFNPDVSSITTDVAALVLFGRDVWLAERRGVLHRYTNSGVYTGFLAGFGTLKDMIAVDGTLFALLEDNKVIRFTPSGAVEVVFQLDLTRNLQAITWQNGYLIVADSTAIYRVSLPE